jgi:aspartate carbamoyltransferase catalytic subunit
MKHLLSAEDFTRDFIFELFALADSYLDLAEKKGESLDILKGKVLAALFYEPSTRTRLSTEVAMLRLGGSVINSVGIENSSLQKGETLHDTAQMVSRYADIIAVRHPQDGSVAEFATGSSVSVINCGDGSNDHPTQVLLDAYTIYREFGRLDNLVVAFVGDLKFSRTSHGLLALLSKFEGNQIRLCSPKQLVLGEKYKYENLTFEIVDEIEMAITGSNVIYSSRVQKERFEDLNEYELLKDHFIFSVSLLEQNAPNAILLHPLPRIYEIKKEVDDWKGARYFDAVINGVAIRMAILTKFLT